MAGCTCTRAASFPSSGWDAEMVKFQKKMSEEKTDSKRSSNCEIEMQPPPSYDGAQNGEVATLLPTNIQLGLQIQVNYRVGQSAIQNFAELVLSKTLSNFESLR